MPEYQPIYDFETEDFSSCLGVEFGKMFAPGRIGYIKPGWGLGNSEYCLIITHFQGSPLAEPLNVTTQSD